MIGAITGTFGVGFVSAVLPVINLELYVVGLLVTHPHLPWLVVGVTAAVGQMLGKALFYSAGRGSVHLSARLRRKMDPERAGRWRARMERFQYTCNRHPAKAAGILLISAAVGLPPFAVMAVAAGTAKVSPTAFATIGLIGRTARFSTLAAAPQLITWLG